MGIIECTIETANCSRDYIFGLRLVDLEVLTIFTKNSIYKPEK